MSAKDHLILAVAERSGFTVENARRLVDAYAHELAEKIRAAADGTDTDNSWVVNAYDAASLIDPAVP